MRDFYDSALKSQVAVDDKQRVRHITHSQQYWEAPDNNPKSAAIAYLKEFAGVYGIDKAEFTNALRQVSFLEPRAQGEEFRLSEEKHQFDTTTLGFYQTYRNIPVWRAGMSVTIKENPSRVVASENTSLEGVQATIPNDEIISRYRKAFDQAAAPTPVKKEGETQPDPGVGLLNEVLGLKTASGEVTVVAATTAVTKLNRGRFFIYKYDAAARVPKPVDIIRGEEQEFQPTFALPPVNAKIVDGKYYMVAELLFTATVAPYGTLNWLLLVELETSSVLYMRALVSNATPVHALVFEQDPLTASGVMTNTANQPEAVLSPFQSDVELPDLNPPSAAGTQALSGDHVVLSDFEAPTIAPPTEPTGTHFDFAVRTNDFAAVNAYYHANHVFEVIESLGFPLNTYFDGTTFPVPVDHRAHIDDPDGVEINAYCAADAQGDGIGKVGFCLGDLTDTTHPLGRAVDRWVHWHEIGGHGTLFDHVKSGSFGFAHSAGDGLAAVQMDPESHLRNLPERFRYAPFRAGLDRWFNRDVAAGWGWGGVKDTGGYNTEQILATTHFRVYRSIGGDSDDVNFRKFASRVMTYLILRAIGDLTTSTNPGTVMDWYKALDKADKGDWLSEGLCGGAYNKVIRWAFEKQGLFQAPTAPTPVTKAGSPPEFDVYIDDGRHGEYDYKAIHYANQSVWNRNAADGIDVHQPAIKGTSNYGYVKIKNRGTKDAKNIVVKAYHSLPGVGVRWPIDFTPMSPAAGITVATVGANNSQEITVGPFEWTPNVNYYGHDCMFVIVSADGDPSNVDLLSAGEWIDDWRLVPNDNNIGQRNVVLIAAAQGLSGLIDTVHQAPFVVRNIFNRKAVAELKIKMPELLERNGWRIRFKEFDTNRMELKGGERRQLTLEVVRGKEISTDQLRQLDERDVRISMYLNGCLMGGMAYRIDPDLKPPDGRRDDLMTHADDLLRDLKLDDARVKRANVRRITVEFELDHDGHGE